MMKKISVGLIVILITNPLLLFLSLIMPVLKLSAFAGLGLGTSDDPYQISNCSQLFEIENNLSAHYQLTADIDCGIIDAPIGISDYNYFEGSLEGDGYTITYEMNTTSNEASLFYGFSHVSIKNLNIDATLSGSNILGNIGGLAVYGNYSLVENISINFELSGTSEVEQFDIGSLFGSGSNNVIRNINSSVNININTIGENDVTSRRIGGLIGNTDNITIQNVNISGEININLNSGDYQVVEYIGGVLGYNENNVTFSNVSSTVNINIRESEGYSGYISVDSVGGVAGAMCEDDGYRCDMDFSVWEGTINISTDVAARIGGLIGEANFESEVFTAKAKENSAHGVININYSQEAVNIGGLFGEVRDAVLAYNYALVEINILTEEEENAYALNIGGLSGESVHVNYWDSYYSGNLTIQSTDAPDGNTAGTIGGLAGYFQNGDVFRSYVQGSMEYGKEANDSDHREIGGLIGRANGYISINNSFVALQVTTLGQVFIRGGIIGVVENTELFTIENVYYDRELEGTGNCTGTEITPEQNNNCIWVNGENSQPLYFLNNNSNVPLNNWDFENVWLITENYPELRSNIDNSSSLFTGEGTEQNPFKISSCIELQQIDIAPISYFELTGDIDCSELEFIPIGYRNLEIFSGHLNGNNYSISNVNIVHTGEGYSGLFAAINSAYLKNFTIDTVFNNGKSYSGALAGSIDGSSEIKNVQVQNATILDCSYLCGGIAGLADSNSTDFIKIQDVSVNFEFIYSEPTNTYAIGGLLGEASKVHIINVSTKGRIEKMGVDSANSAGLIGHLYSYDPNYPSIISKTYSDVDIITQSDEDFAAAYYSGGLIGNANDLMLSDSYSTGSFTIEFNGTSSIGNIGGLIGNAYNTTIANSYTTVELNLSAASISDTAGFLGGFGIDNSISNSFSAATLNINGEPDLNSIGLFLTNVNDTIVENSYFDVTKGKFDSYFGNGESMEGVTPVNEDGSQNNYFIANSENPPLNVWDFETTWFIEPEHYPKLQESNDTDGDGISNSIEDSGPNNGDANNDGIPDKFQPNVTSVFNHITGKYSVLVSTCSSHISVSIQAEADNAVQDNAYNYTAGFMSFTLECEEGATAQIKHYHYGDFNSSLAVMRKYNNITNTYKTILDSTSTNQEIDGQKVLILEFQIQDGSEFDLDGEINGFIVDPSGPGFSSVGVPNTGIGGTSNPL